MEIDLFKLAGARYIRVRQSFFMGCICMHVVLRNVESIPFEIQSVDRCNPGVILLMDDAKHARTDTVMC